MGLSGVARSVTDSYDCGQPTIETVGDTRTRILLRNSCHPHIDAGAAQLPDRLRVGLASGLPLQLGSNQLGSNQLPLQLAALQPAALRLAAQAHSPQPTAPEPSQPRDSAHAGRPTAPAGFKLAAHAFFSLD